MMSAATHTHPHAHTDTPSHAFITHPTTTEATTTKSATADATTWNTRAVSHLQRGDVSNCMLIIKNELACVRANFVKVANTSSSDMTMTSSSTSSTTQACAANIQSVPLQHHCSWDDEEQSPHNLFSFYPRAFVMQNDSSNSSTDIMQVDSMASMDKADPRYLVVLLYNLALAHHLEAAAQLERNAHASTHPHFHRSLLHARHLYKSALEVADSSFEAADLQEQRCILLAILNNLGHVASHQMHFIETRHCLQMMCQLVDVETTCSYETATVPDDDFELFFQSVFTYLDTSSTGVEDDQASASLDQLLCLAPAA